MIRIVAGWFVAGVVLNDSGRVARAAPIVRYMTGWTSERVREYAAGRRWSIG